MYVWQTWARSCHQFNITPLEWLFLTWPTFPGFKVTPTPMGHALQQSSSQSVTVLQQSRRGNQTIISFVEYLCADCLLERKVRVNFLWKLKQSLMRMAFETASDATWPGWIHPEARAPTYCPLIQIPSESFSFAFFWCFSQQTCSHSSLKRTLTPRLFSCHV